MIYLILICMIFMHIVDDYYLQGILASMKQKSWWEKNAPDPMYKHDYIAALIAHAFSWTFMMMLPVVLFTLFNGQLMILAIIPLFIINMILHASIDDLKANKHMIDLITDQILHIAQIIITWYALIGGF